MNQTAELARQFTVSLADFKSALKLLNPDDDSSGRGARG